MTGEMLAEPAPAPRSVTIPNERTKLTATWLNSIAAAAVAVGGISPTIAAASGVISLGLAAVLVPAWIAAGLGLCTDDVTPQIFKVHTFISL